jgi:hypothetical protein
MNNRWFAILIVGCLGLAGGGCALRGQRHRQAQRHTQEVLLPRQTGSNLDRRITVDDESSFKPIIQPESKPPSKKRAKTERTKSKRAEPKKPGKSEETTPPPDRFR